MTSATAILRDYQGNVIDTTQLPLLFSICGKARDPTKPKRAQQRAVREVFYPTKTLTANTQAYFVAPGIIPEIASFIDPSARDSQQGVDNIRGETLLEEVVPQKGPTTGGTRINLWGQNLPANPIFVRFGDNCVRAVS